jgi:hypothetical protein
MEKVFLFASGAGFVGYIADMVFGRNACATTMAKLGIVTHSGEALMTGSV